MKVTPEDCELLSAEAEALKNKLISMADYAFDEAKKSGMLTPEGVEWLRRRDELHKCAERVYSVAYNLDVLYFF